MSFFTPAVFTAGDWSDAFSTAKALRFCKMSIAFSSKHLHNSA
jgi:hypothetical protein